MQNFIQNPLKVIIHPDGVQFGMSGDTIELHITVTNEGEQSAVIDLFLEEGLQSLTGNNISLRESLALNTKQSQEVTFLIKIPIDTLPGTYDYTLVVDSPNHYPQYTPINYPRQIKVLLKEQTVIRPNDPTFSLEPTTNPNKPLVFKRGEVLQVQVIVDNRSNLVDRFRLSCPDLNDNWFTIIYPRLNSENQGLLSDVTALELLPGARGQIRIEFNPPTDTFAGNYSPTICLHSENSPNLVLLELIYILIPGVYHLDVVLNTILGQVSWSPGKYELKLTNQGNTVRKLMLSAQTRDEEELCTYTYEQTEIQLFPSKIVGVNLTVKPNSWWRRPLFGGGLVLNFDVQVKDQKDLPLPDTLPQGSLLWKARPWWQLVLLILVILALLGGVGFLIWRFLNPDPLRIENFQANPPQIVEGDGEVVLNWDIYNYKQLKNLLVQQQEPQTTSPTLLSYSLSELESKCLIDRTQKELLSCKNVTTGITRKDKYTLEIQANSRKNKQPISKYIKVEIIERPIAEVLSFNTDKSQYTNGDKILFSWEIKLPTELERVEITGKSEDGTLAGETVRYDFKEDGTPPENLTKECKIDNQNQTEKCTNIPIVISKPGNLTFEIKAFSKRSNRTSSQQTQTKIKVLPKPLKIVSFKLNNSEEPSRVFKDGESITLQWKVEGEQGTRVQLFPFSTVNLQGTMKLTANQGLPSLIELRVSDPFGSQPINKAFSLQVVTPQPTPTPTLTPIFTPTPTFTFTPPSNILRPIAPTISVPPPTRKP